MGVTDVLQDRRTISWKDFVRPLREELIAEYSPLSPQISLLIGGRRSADGGHGYGLQVPVSSERRRCHWITVTPFCEFLYFNANSLLPTPLNGFPTTGAVLL
jgi:hypothetical protein